MKRKDWKINSLKEDIYGNFNKLKINRRIFFLRKLIFRKHKTLIKRNLILNYFFLSNLLSNFKISKKLYFNYIFNSNKNYLNYLPEFTFKKKINNLFINFKKTQKHFNFLYYNLKNDSNQKGFTIRLFNIKNEEIFDKFLLDDNNKNILSKKLNCLDIYTKNEFNFYFNFNLNINCSLEIYKILLYVYFFNLHQNN